MLSKTKNPKNLLAAAWRNFGFSSMGTCCGFAISHGEATGGKRGERCQPAQCYVYRRFLSTINLSPIFIADICRLFLSLVFLNTSDNAMRSEAKRNKSVIAPHQNHYNFVIGGCNLRASCI